MLGIDEKRELMTGKKRIRNPYADEVTAPYEAPAVPLVLEDDETTVPVDVGEMEAAAAASRRPDGPGRQPHVIRRSLAKGSAPVPGGASTLMAEIQVSGTAQVVTLPVRNISPTGAGLEIPAGTDLRLSAGATVMVTLRVGSAQSGEPSVVRVRARVAHRRRGRPSKPGGMAMRWELDDPRTRTEIDRVLERVKGT